MNPFLEAIEALLRQHATPAAVRAVEQGAARGDEPGAPWQALADAGFLELLAPEADGGAGLPWSGLREIATALGRHAAPLPWAASMAARLLLQPMPAPWRQARITLASHTQAPGCAERVPWGAVAELLLAPQGDDAVVVERARARLEPVAVHGSLAATWHWDPHAECRRLPGAARLLRHLAAALHAAQMAGAMEQVLALTVRHARERQQFGQPIGRFQAVQQQLAVLAEEVAAARLAVACAFDDTAAEPGEPRAPGGPSAWGAAVAKARCSEAAAQACAIAHAVHGAMGITAEHDLQLYTRRLHDWRVEQGSEAYWQRALGEGLLAQPVVVAEWVRRGGAPSSAPVAATA